MAWATLLTSHWTSPWTTIGLAFSAEGISRLFTPDFTVLFQTESQFISGATHYPDPLSVLRSR